MSMAPVPLRSLALARLPPKVLRTMRRATPMARRSRTGDGAARIIVRCYQDEFVDLLGTLGASEVISSSKSAFREIEAHLAVQP